MSLLDFFRKRNPSASIAKERLQIVLAHERAGRHAPDFLPLLQRKCWRWWRNISMSPTR
jgi:cell division topological specificity factor